MKKIPRASSAGHGIGMLWLCLGVLSACDYVAPDPMPPRGDEWVIDAYRRAHSGSSQQCRTKMRFYRDRDGDGFGDPRDSVEGCSPPEGYVQNGEDCYDQNPNAYPGQTESFATDRGDGSFDYDCDGRQSKRMTNRAYCMEKEDGSGCRSASGWVESKIPGCGKPGRWRWYECVGIVYRAEPEQAPSAGSPVPLGATPTGRAVLDSSQSSAPRPAGRSVRPATVPGLETLSPEFKKRFVCKGRLLPWKKRQLCR